MKIERDVMEDEWCCLICYARFRFGRLKLRDGALRCPVCGAAETAAADGRTYEVTLPPLPSLQD